MSSDIRKIVESYGLQVTGNNKICCPFHKEKTPSLTLYEDADKFWCYGCGAGTDTIDFVQGMEPDLTFKQAVSKVEEVLGRKVELGTGEEKKRSEKRTEAPTLPMEVLKELAANTEYQNVGYRGIRKETDEYFKHRSKVVNGEVVARYYPETNQDGAITRLKCRVIPKDFNHNKHIGKSAGPTGQFSGQFKCSGGGKYVMIVGGEDDKAAAHQMFVDYQRGRNQEDLKLCDVVSARSGEGTAHKECAAQYDFLDEYDFIILGLDNDKAGLAAMEECLKVLPKEKVKIVKWSRKDPHKMLEERLQKQFIRDFYNAKEVMTNGIKSSKDCLPEVFEFLAKPRISLPQYMHRLQEMCGGGQDSGILQESVVNIIADTSVGKSTHVNNIVHHLLFSAPEKPGVISLEATAGPYLIDMISLHIGENVMRKGMTNEEVSEYLKRENVYERYKDLIEDEFGQEKFKIVDERSGKLEALQKQMEVMFHRDGVRIFVIDVLSDILRSLGNDEQEKFMMWEKNFVKGGATVFNVLHTRKIPADAEGKKRLPTEYDALGSSTFPQSAHINIVLHRDKVSNDLVEKNTTIPMMPKCRGGETGGWGSCGEWYYDVPTRQSYDKADYFNGVKDSAKESFKQEQTNEDGGIETF